MFRVASIRRIWIGLMKSSEWLGGSVEDIPKNRKAATPRPMKNWNQFAPIDSNFLFNKPRRTPSTVTKIAGYGA
jgi:hypothetical protein